MKHMAEIGVRALKQNASAVVARAASGDIVTITDRGRPVAQMTAIPSSPLERLLISGRIRPPHYDLSTLPPPEPGPCLSNELARMRDAERF